MAVKKVACEDQWPMRFCFSYDAVYVGGSHQRLVLRQSHYVLNIISEKKKNLPKAEPVLNPCSVLERDAMNPRHSTNYQ